MRGRRNKFIKRASLILGIGLAYALFCGITKWYLPCPFHAVTGLYCPGCGVSRMCMSLLRLDLHGAWRANSALLLLAPLLGGLLLKQGWAYVRLGRSRATRGESALTWAMAVLLLGFGILRNLPGFAVLLPR